MNQWRKVLVKDSTSLQRAIEVLDEFGLRIVLVVDDADILLGTVTDGDVRRALLRSLPMDTPVNEVMNRNPKTARADWTESRIRTLMDGQGLLQLPLVDDAQRVVGLATLQGSLKESSRDNPVLLMAGGFGTRLQPLTNNLPKPMLKVGGKPILERILVDFVDAGFHRFYISTHYLSEVIREHFGNGEKWGVEIQYIHEDEPLGTAGALGLLPKGEIDLPVVIMNGDLQTSLNPQSLLEFHEERRSMATVCVREYEHQVPYGVITADGAKVQTMIEKPIHKYFVNTGIYLLSPELVKSVKPNIRLDMPTLLVQQIEQDKPVYMFPIHEHWLDIGQTADFERAQRNEEHGWV
mgnify:CR=1 FL=1